MINQVQALRKEYERDHLPFEIHTTGTDAYTPAGIEKLAEIGVDLVYVGFFNIYSGKPDERSLEQKLAQIEHYAERVINPSRVAGKP
jgi:hypothetical protein